MADITFTQLRKLSRRSCDSLPKYRLAVIGDCATQHLATAIRGYGVYADLGLSVFDADYNQIDAQTLDAGSELYAFAPNAVLIQMCTEKLYEAFCVTPLNRRATFGEDTYAQIRQIWQRINENLHTTILQCNFPLMDDGVLVNMATKQPTHSCFSREN